MLNTFSIVSLTLFLSDPPPYFSNNSFHFSSLLYRFLINLIFCVYFSFLSSLANVKI